MAYKLTDKKEKAVVSTKKAQGTITKVLEMIQEDKYCIDVIQQVDAAIGLLNATKKALLEGHLDHCLEHKLHENKQQTIDELMKIYNLGKK
jgi:CsoR family transcriptional regulator, copper-sensing transcriptional repressor